MRAQTDKRTDRWTDGCYQLHYLPALQSYAVNKNTFYLYISDDNWIGIDSDVLWQYLGWVNTLLGVTVMVILSFKHASFMATLHENDMWFTNIKVGLEWVNSLLGVTVMVILSFKHASFMATLHENDMWFTNIKVGFKGLDT